MAKRSFAQYLWAAFKHHWNLLAVGAATAVGFISGHPDIIIPVVAAGELAYLVSTAGHPRFQNYVDHYANITSETAGTEQRIQELLDGIPDADRAEWLRLKEKCVGIDAGPYDAIATEQMDGVNKLLWVHLKLLHTKKRLERFLGSVDERDITSTLQHAKSRLDNLTGEDPITVKKRKSLEDTIATVQARLDNVRKARENFDYVKVELTRITAKIEGVVEMAQNRQDAGTLTNEVDDAARSVEATEQMIGELQSFTGLTQDDARAPDILRRAQAAAQRVRAGG